MKTVNIINLGCSKNLVDSEHLARQLQLNGYKVVFDHNEPHRYILINTCGFIHDAQQESIDTILEATNIKAKNPGTFIGVFGCLTQLFAQELKTEIPEVDAWFGKYDSKQILKALGGACNEQLNHQRYIATPPHYAYLKIAEGCHRKCAFCSIPKITGTYKSEPIDKLFKEAEYLAEQGVKELILIAQDLTWYGRDLPDTPTLTRLIRELSQIDGIHWIRLHYAYPAGIPGDLFDEMRKNPKVCRYMDIPVQHISDEMLKKMRRGHNQNRTRAIIADMRNKVPDIEIRTTLIVGFPGETKTHFNDLLEFTKQAAFEKMGAFTYSHEQYTYAYDNYSDNVPETIKNERLEQLMAIQYDIALTHQQKKIGKIFEVIIDRKEGELYYGRSEFDSPEVDGEIIITSKTALQPGCFYQVKITGAEAFDLYGKPINYA